jgi:hypothetical protein
MNNEIPSQTYHTFWIYVDRDKTIEVLEKYQKKAVGKWLLFMDKDKIDKAWEVIKEATLRGLLGYSAKVSTVKFDAQKDSSQRVICVYTYHWQDEEDVFRVEKALRTLGFQMDLCYKTNETTLQGKDFSNASQEEICTYFSEAKS